QVHLVGTNAEAPGPGAQPEVELHGLVAGLDVVPRAVDAPELLRVDLHDPVLLGKVDPAPATRLAIRVLDELLGRRSTQGRPWVLDHLMVTAVAADRAHQLPPVGAVAAGRPP